MNKREILNLLYKEKDYGQVEKLCKKRCETGYYDILAVSLYKQNKFGEAARIYHNLEKYGEEACTAFSIKM